MVIHKDKIMAFKFRKGADNGLWCSTLLPVCLIPFINADSGFHLLNFAICSTCCLFSIFTEQKSPTSNSYRNGITISGYAALLSLFLSHWFSYNLVVMFIVCHATLWYYSYLVRNLLLYCPGSFTLGEAQLISQGVIMFLHCCIVTLLNEYNVLNNGLHFQVVPESVRSLQIMLLGTFLLLQTLYMVPFLKEGLKFFISCFAVLFLMMGAWQISLKQNVFLWLFSFCNHSKTRMLIILFWFVSTLASVTIVIITNKWEISKGSSITRKYFHLIINAIYIPGILYDQELLIFASGVALTIFILLEVCRIINAFIIGPVIEDAFQVFLDEKDSGFLILSHIYLLIGCSSPIWLYGYSSNSQSAHISLFSGVISVGFGDTAAAIGGTLFGQNNWKGSKKTYEGTICAFTVQLITSLFFLSYGHVFSTWNVFLTVIAIFSTSILEAKTTQVDNLVLPLFLFSFLSWIL
ncbi:hypothetical protein JTE90_019741 [Oedothorax gibbosus]|uniref:dolichol kinase n=1 Tax=Oedothorax gibbosus TaxID=931172 RepID=A0AAV6UPD6_9ARAC|nr:hypothetical protein JTE90_019741 [Oedothorax gibbosus]